jgi:hypothetical protein
MESFKARVQHGDWDGTAAADVKDSSSVEEYLEKKGLIHPGGSLVAISVSPIEKRSTAGGGIVVRAFFYKGENFDSIANEIASSKESIPVREARVELRPE